MFALIFTKKELGALLLLLILSFILVFGSRYNRLYNSQAISSEISVELYLTERTNLQDLGIQLEKLSIEIDKDELNWAGRVLGWRFFRPGLYVIDQDYSYGDFLSKLARGIQDPANVTVLPGTDRDRLSRMLAAQLSADSISFRSLFTDSSDLAMETGLTGEELFSRMLPNTYQIYWTSNPQAVVRRILNEFNSRVTNQYSDQIANSGYDVNEIVTLASIVEWEARLNDEKPKIAGLYLNRLNRNMLLQADPTVLYAIGERRRVLFEDYQFDHPYNTYINRGLPPGPITNPDESSIIAVLEPMDHEYLFMVAAPDGSHQFSRTFEEHRQASAEWRRWIREQYRIRDQREREEALLEQSE